MHFLSHYYLDRGRYNPLFVTGSLLPDIAHGFTKTYNSVIRKGGRTYAGDDEMIHRGVLRHYEVDALFHGSGTFRQVCTFASDTMISEGLDREKYRLWFLSHIAAEVVLDIILIRQNPGIVQEYYDVLSSVEINKLDVYLNSIVAPDEKSKIMANFNRFKEVKFLFNLDRIEGAAEGIIRTAYRATGVVFPDVDRAKLMAALHNIENDMRYRSGKLLALESGEY
jgi:hypothetical protein